MSVDRFDDRDSVATVQDEVMKLNSYVIVIKIKVEFEDGRSPSKMGDGAIGLPLYASGPIWLHKPLQSRS